MQLQIPATFIPRSIVCLRNYSLSTFVSDLIAGLTVGLVALPLAMAFAMSSGVAPQTGLYCAVVAGFLISALGGSNTQIGGPTGAFVVVVSGIVAKYGLDGLYMSTLMAGILLIVLGITGFGQAVKYIPRPVVIGFTNGIAVLIASTQLKDFFGLQLEHVPSEFGPRIKALMEHAGSFSPLATYTAVGALLLIIGMRRYYPKIPGTIVALFLGTGIAWIFKFDVRTIETAFGEIPAGLPQLVIPTFRLDLVPVLLSPALTIAMLGAIESLLSAVVADRMTGDRHNPNVELFAQGVANVFSPLFGGLPATGAIARTATNIRSGAKTPVAGMIHALTLLAILLVAAPLAKHIPLSILAAILLVVSYNMGEWREIPEILRLTKASIAVWAITFGLTVFADLTVAVEAGMTMAALLYIRKVTNTTSVDEVTPAYVDESFAHSLQVNEIPASVSVFTVQGPFLFGAADKLAVVGDRIESLGQVVILTLRNMTALDATGLHAFENLADQLIAKGKVLILCGLQAQPELLMRKAKFHEHIGDANICTSLRDSLDRAQQIVTGIAPPTPTVGGPAEREAAVAVEPLSKSTPFTN